ncbi:MAG TPA: AfsA-related hotdog domain-containing protein [Microbacteriaceae bacterium]
MQTDVRHLDHSAAHRSTRSELLVSQLTQRSDADWEVDLSLPRSHWLCHPSPGLVPLTLTAEALRQAGLAVCVAGLGMDPSVHFVISALSAHTDREQLVFPRFGAFECTAAVSFAEIVYRKGLPHRLEVGYTIGTAVTAHISAQVLSDLDYRVVRRGAQALGDAVFEHAETLLIDPVRTGASARATLGVNEADPFFFDHPVDHLPGMLLLHAAAALHEHATGAPATTVEITFPAFAELRVPTHLHAEIDKVSSRTTISQGDRSVAEVFAKSAGVLAGGAAHV